jgi:hypothetical protein
MRSIHNSLLLIKINYIFLVVEKDKNVIPLDYTIPVSKKYVNFNYLILIKGMEGYELASSTRVLVLES